MENIEIYQGYWENLSIPGRKILLQSAISQYEKGIKLWDYSDAGTMAKTTSIGDFPAVLLSFLLPILLDSIADETLMQTHG